MADAKTAENPWTMLSDHSIDARPLFSIRSHFDSLDTFGEASSIDEKSAPVLPGIHSSVYETVASGGADATEHQVSMVNRNPLFMMPDEAVSHENSHLYVSEEDLSSDSLSSINDLATTDISSRPSIPTLIFDADKFRTSETWGMEEWQSRASIALANYPLTAPMDRLEPRFPVAREDRMRSPFPAFFDEMHRNRRIVLAVRNAKRILRIIDADGSGNLSLSELSAFLSGVYRWPDILIRAKFDSLLSISLLQTSASLSSTINSADSNGSASIPWRDAVLEIPRGFNLGSDGLMDLYTGVHAIAHHHSAELPIGFWGSFDFCKVQSTLKNQTTNVTTVNRFKNDGKLHYIFDNKTRIMLGIATACSNGDIIRSAYSRDRLNISSFPHSIGEISDSNTTTPRINISSAIGGSVSCASSKISGIRLGTRWNVDSSNPVDRSNNGVCGLQMRCGDSASTDFVSVNFAREPGIAPCRFASKFLQCPRKSDGKQTFICGMSLRFSRGDTGTGFALFETENVYTRFDPVGVSGMKIACC